MMDVLSDQLLNTEEVAKLARVHCKTVRRWMRVGVRNNEQDVVRLESRKIGRQRYTSPEAYDRFVERTSAEGRGDEE